MVTGIDPRWVSLKSSILIYEVYEIKNEITALTMLLAEWHEVCLSSLNEVA